LSILESLVTYLLNLLVNKKRALRVGTSRGPIGDTCQIDLRTPPACSFPAPFAFLSNSTTSLATPLDHNQSAYDILTTPGDANASAVIPHRHRNSCSWPGSPSTHRIRQSTQRHPHYWYVEYWLGCSFNGPCEHSLCGLSSRLH
jgi:hypothetical protein